MKESFPKVPSPSPDHEAEEPFKKEALDELTPSELVKFADAHKLVTILEVNHISGPSVSITPPFTPPGETSRASYPLTKSYRSSAVKMNDPCWEAFRSTKNDEPIRPQKTFDDFYSTLPLVKNYNARLLALQESGFPDKVKELALERKRRAYECYVLLGKALQTWIETRSLFVQVLLSKREGTSSLAGEAKSLIEEHSIGMHSPLLMHASSPIRRTLKEMLAKIKEYRSLSVEEKELVDWFAEVVRELENYVKALETFDTYSLPFIKNSDFEARYRYEHFIDHYTSPILAALRGQDPAPCFHADCENTSPEAFLLSRINLKPLDAIHERLRLLVGGEASQKQKPTTPYR